MITMLLGGLWHGASWNFVIWGAHARRAADRISVLWQRPRSLILTQIFILFTWIAFRVREPHAMLTAMRKFVLFDFDFALAGRGLLTIFFFSTIALIAASSRCTHRASISRLRDAALRRGMRGHRHRISFLWPRGADAVHLLPVNFRAGSGRRLAVSSITEI